MSYAVAVDTSRPDGTPDPTSCSAGVLHLLCETAEAIEEEDKEVV